MLVHLLALVLWIAPQDKHTCFTCNSTGIVPCKRHGKELDAAEAAALHCSILIACPDCQGTGMKPCGRCKNRSPENEQRRAANLAWLQQRQLEIDDFMGRPLAHAESAHFKIVFDLPKITPDDKTLDLHHGMHLYLDRLEAFWRDFSADMHVQESEFLSKTCVMLWNRKADQEKAALKYTLQTSDTESKLMGKAPVFSIFYDKNFMHEEYELHQAVVHQTAHCLMSNLWDGLWPGNQKGGWLDEGVAHLYEVRYFGGVRHYCYREQDTLGLYKFGKWESETRSLLQQRAGESVLRSLYKNTDVLSKEEHVLSWSFCDFVNRSYPDKLGFLLKCAKQGMSPGEAVHTVLQRSPAVVEAEWAEYVKKSYSPLK